LRVFANGGGWIGVWALSHEKGQVLNDTLYPSYLTIDVSALGNPSTSFDHKRDFNSRTDNRFDGGLMFGAGLQYDIKYISFFAEWRYDYSLTDMVKKYEKYDHVPYMNTTWTISGGILVNLGIFRR
jgi:hypothetical protein